MKIINDIILVMTSYPKRIKYVPDILNAWSLGKNCPSKIALYLSLDEYPNKEQSIPCDIYNKLKNLNVQFIFRMGNERGFKSYFAGDDFKNTWILQIDDDIMPEINAFDKFYENHIKYPNCFITWSPGNITIGNGTLYNPGMLDKRYLIDMPKVVPYILDDLWLLFWTNYSNINIIGGLGFIRNCINEVQDDGLTSGNKDIKNIISRFKKYMFTTYKIEYEIVKRNAKKNNNSCF